jgi:hypothetical protein
MKQILPMLLLAALAVAGCSKSIIDKTKANPAGDFTLRLNTVDLNGQVNSRVETALNMEGAGELAAVIEPKQDKVVMRLGGMQLSPNVPISIMATIQFLHTNKSQDIAGEYQLPRDSDKINVVLGRKNGDEWTFKYPPKSGTVTVIYDASTNTWKGEITGLEYTVALNEPFIQMSLSGRFSHIPAR